MAPAIDRSRPRTVFRAYDTRDSASRITHHAPRARLHAPICLRGSLYQLFQIRLLA